MNKIIMICSCLLILAACGNSGQKNAQNVESDRNIVYVYYFHGKQRCKTCNAVEEVTKKAIADYYASNPNIKFTVVPNFEKENDALVEKYEVSWNALIIDKNGNMIDLTEEAFGNAVDNPESLTDLIKAEINSRLQ